MKASKLLIACAAVLAGTSAAQADTVVHISGSTAFRGATITAIQNLMGGTGNFKAAYQSSSGASTTASNQCVIQGTIAGLPPGANPVTVKCSWSGSVGGIQTIVSNADVTTWMSVTNLPADNSVVAPTTISYALDTSAFSGENAKVDVVMADNSQVSSGFNAVTLNEKKVGIIPFEWVVNHGSPATIDNITPLLAQAVLSGGAPVSQFTGNAADYPAQANPPQNTIQTVYAVGRNFDSGTRLSCLAETGVGIFSGVVHLQPTITGTPNGSDGQITQLKLYPAENILGTDYSNGQSGYGSGGALADVLATPGSQAAVVGTPVPGPQRVGFGPGCLIAYLGRSDAQRATKTTGFNGNNAHRLKWNGLQIWNGSIQANGVPAGGYNDSLITEGLYNLWEYEYLDYRSGLDVNRKAVADKIAAQIENVDATASGLKLNTMHVGKSIEGGLIGHN
jgi:hypothetical protein